jgi:hypothetical protein
VDVDVRGRMEGAESVYEYQLCSHKLRDDLRKPRQKCGSAVGRAPQRRDLYVLFIDATVYSVKVEIMLCTIGQ